LRLLRTIRGRNDGTITSTLWLLGNIAGHHEEILVHVVEKVGVLTGNSISGPSANHGVLSEDSEIWANEAEFDGIFISEDVWEDLFEYHADVE